MPEKAAEQPFIGRRARRTGVAQTAASDAAPWRSSIADAGAHRFSAAVEPLGEAPVVAEPIVEAEPIAPAAAADLKSERLIFDEPGDGGQDAVAQARAEQARSEQAVAERIAAEQAAAEQARVERIAAERQAELARAEQIAAQERAERIAAERAAAEQARAEQARAEQIAAQERAERIAAEQAHAEQLAAQAHAEQIAAEARAEQIAADQAAAHARAEEEERLARLRAERAEQARAEQAAAQQRRAAQASASQASEPVAGAGTAAENGARVTDASVDAFSAAAEAFGFSADDLDETVETVEPAFEASPVDEAKKTDDETSASHVAPRRRRFGRKIVAAGASLGVMAVTGLMLVSTTLPSEAVAAAQGQDAQSVTSLTAASEETSQRKAVEKDIQAFVAPSDVTSEEIARSGEYSSMSMADLAAEEGIRYSTSVYTNDTTAAIQWPFAVGTGMSWPYGMRRGRMHQGIDLIPGNGAPIQAIADGVVRKATENGGGYGVTVYIDHMIDGKVVTSHYSHMQHGSIRVKTGQQVKVGDIVGLVGNTGHSFGAHLHFELLRNGQTFDPLPWMKKNAGRHDGVGPIS